MGVGEIVAKITHYSEPARYAAMCRATYDNFKRVVDFEAEAQAIRQWLQTMV
jgi:hypothetical protein